MSLHKDWQNYSFILDTTHLLPDQVAEHELDQKYRVAFIGYPNISVEEKLVQIRAHQTEQADWTREINDNGMRPIIQKMIDLGKTLEEECDRCNIPFFDTSKDFKEVLQNAFRYCMQDDNTPAILPRFGPEV